MLGRLAARAGLATIAALAIATSLHGQEIAAETRPPSSPEQIREALAAIRGSPIQWELPVDEPRGGGSGLGIGLPLLTILLLAVAAIVLVVLAFFVASVVRDRRRPAVADPAAEIAPTPSFQLSGAPLERAEAAAREGRFADAIHLLLLGTIEEIRASLGFEAHPSLTSREILGRAPLPDGAEPPLGGIIREVEWSHFGARGATETEYRRCVEWHGDLRRACDAGAPTGRGERRGGAGRARDGGSAR